MEGGKRMNLPESVMKRIDEISQRTGISQEEINREYEELFNDPFIQQDPQFSTDEERHRYAIAVLWTRYVSRPPVREFEIIPIGFSSVRITKSGVPMSNLFALVKSGNGVKLRRIVLRGEQAEAYKNITLCSKYITKLGEIGTGGDLIADNRTRFENPVGIKLTLKEILDQLNIPKITVKDAEKKPSRTDSTGYVDILDWRVVRGIIVRANRGKRDDGSEYGVLTIADESVSGEPRVTPDGRVLRPGLTVWIAPELMLYEVESEVDVAGTIQIGQKTGEPLMNAFVISPVHAKEAKIDGS
jgi:hypothetical protein